MQRRREWRSDCRLRQNYGNYDWLIDYLCTDAGFRLYGDDVVSEEIDAANYSQHLRELQNYITQPQPTSLSTNHLPLSDVTTIPEETTLHVRLTWLHLHKFHMQSSNDN